MNLTHCSDAELIHRARSESGTEPAGELLRRYRPLAFSIALRKVGSVESAQEVVQEALLQAFLSLPRLRCDTHFPAWLFGIVRNVAHGYLRRQGSALLTESDAAVEDVAAPETLQPQAITEEREQKRLILNAIHTLSPANRDVILLFYYEQQSLNTISEMLGISVVAVKGRLNKARRQLRQPLCGLQPTASFVGSLSDRALRRKEIRMIPVEILWVDHRNRVMNQEDPLASETTARNFVLATLASQSPGFSRDHVLLFNTGQNRALPVSVGGWTTTDAIVQGYFGEPEKNETPSTYPLMERLLDVSGMVLESVTIDVLADDIVFAVLNLTRSGTTVTVNARPGDALALAAQRRDPVFVSEPLFRRDAWELRDARAGVERCQGDPGAAIDEPFIKQTAEGIIAQAVGYLLRRKDAEFAEVLLEHRMTGGRFGFVWMELRAGGGSSGSNVPMPVRVLPLLIARFRHLASEGRLTMEINAKVYEVQVATEPTETEGSVRLRLQARTAVRSTPTQSTP